MPRKKPRREQALRPATETRGAETVVDPSCRCSYMTRGKKLRRGAGTEAERLEEARATLARGPVIVFAHVRAPTNQAALDSLVLSGEATREVRTELDLAAFSRGELTMRKIIVYQLIKPCSSPSSPSSDS